MGSGFIGGGAPMIGVVLGQQKTFWIGPHVANIFDMKANTLKTTFHTAFNKMVD